MLVFRGCNYYGFPTIKRWLTQKPQAEPPNVVSQVDPPYVIPYWIDTSKRTETLCKMKQISFFWKNIHLFHILGKKIGLFRAGFSMFPMGVPCFLREKNPNPKGWSYLSRGQRFHPVRREKVPRSSLGRVEVYHGHLVLGYLFSVRWFCLMDSIPW